MSDTTTTEAPAVNFIPGEAPFKQQLKELVKESTPATKEERVVNLPRSSEMDPVEKAKQLVMENYNAFRNASRVPALTVDLVTVLWFSGSRNNWKAQLESPIVHGLRYEVSYNARRGEAFIDVFKKINNVKATDNAPPVSV